MNLRRTTRFRRETIQRSPGKARSGLPWALALLTVFCAPWGRGQETLVALNSAEQFKRMTLEELLNVEVTTTARKPELLFSTPSSVQVISEEEIRRSGATSLPEALRLASNLQVAQVDSRQWAISARGFNNTLANKLLVMIDGRTIYTPLFAGVFWDKQDTMMEDIDRIEVVSGPGATLWGANAVNGVINIITKSAKDTQGALITGGGGNQLNGFGGARFGGKLSENVFVRVYGKYFHRDNTVMPSGADATNEWHQGQGGFRMDWLPESGDALTLQGDLYGSEIEQPTPGSTSLNGHNVLGRWTHLMGEDSDLAVQLYWDRTHRRIPGSFTEDLNTFDLDFQHRFPLGERQSIVWGGGYRLMADEVENGPALAFLPQDRNLQLFSGFLQDDITLIIDRLHLFVGSKIEHNDYSGVEVQPSGRLAWTPTDRQTIWGAISRAVRSPSRVDRDLFFPATPPFAIAGGPNFDSEKLLAYELGYRWRPVDRLTLSVASFFNDYDDIRSISTNTLTIENENAAEIWGVEFSATYQLVEWWRVRGGYTYLHKYTFIEPGGSDLNQGRAEGNDPEHQFLLQSMIDLPYRLQFDGVLRFVDSLPDPPVPSYVALDLRLAWQATDNLELSVVGQNLLDEQHPEFGPPATRQEIPRSVYGKVTWRF